MFAMPRIRRLPIALALTVVVAALSLIVTVTSGAVTAQGPATPTPAVPYRLQVQLDEAMALRLWQFLENSDYAQSWSTIPGKGTMYPGQGPHGELITTYLSPEAAAALETRPGLMANGATIVKENYLADGTLDSLTVMQKQVQYNPGHNDWLWAKYGPDGEVQAAGRPPGCISCHGSVWSNDYVFSFPIAPLNPSLPNPGKAGVGSRTGTATPTAVDAEEAALVREGAEQARQLGCLTCHSATGEALVGPTFRGLYGGTVSLAGGGRVVADEEYLRRAIAGAHGEFVLGFPGGVMPDFSQDVNDETLTALIAFIKSLGVDSEEAALLPPPPDTSVQMALTAAGREYSRQFGCLTCHSTSGEGSVGPTWKGLYGSVVTLADGRQVVAGEVYLRRSILNGHADIAADFPDGIMPDYSERINDSEMEAILAFMRSLR